MKAITDTQITYLILIPGTLSSPKHVYLILIPGTPFSSPKHKSYTIQSLCYPYSKKGFSKIRTHNLLHSNSCLKQLSYWNRQGRNNFFKAISMRVGRRPRACLDDVRESAWDDVRESARDDDKGMTHTPKTIFSIKRVES